ncbi:MULTISPECIES: CapA family protein [Spirulina sp. CCY15215]|uniref:CapA family protein n=1 Tax=Spirulina sp. CCY15215 TaxID=2767591 RepID=UPI001950E324|nr:CapA family protein [Spirulina major]
MLAQKCENISNQENSLKRGKMSLFWGKFLREITGELTPSSRIFLRTLFCTFSFILGVGYSAVQEANELSEESTVRLIADNIPDFPRPDRLRIKAVGDIIPGTNYPYNRLHPRKEELLAEVEPLLDEAEIVFGNFESTLTNATVSAKQMGSGLVFAFRTPPDYSNLLKEAGFDVLNIANNHSLDFGDRGFQDTVANIEKAGIKAIGEKDKIVYTYHEGAKIAWLGFSYFPHQNSILNLPKSLALVQKAEANADIVIVSIHAGAEGTAAMHVRDRTEYFYGENRGNLVQFSRSAIDAGADLILGHGPHVPRSLELYRHKLIAYSLGNFLGYKTLSNKAELGYSLVLEVELDDRGDFLSGQIHPVRLQKNGIPQPSDRGETIQLIQRLTQSDFPHTPLTITPEGQILRNETVLAKELAEELAKESQDHINTSLVEFFLPTGIAAPEN